MLLLCAFVLNAQQADKLNYSKAIKKKGSIEQQINKRLATDRQQYLEGQEFLLEQQMLNEQHKLQWKERTKGRGLTSAEDRMALEQKRQEGLKVMHKRVQDYGKNFSGGAQPSGEAPEVRKPAPVGREGMALHRDRSAEHLSVRGFTRPVPALKSAQEANMKLDGISGKFWDNSLPGSWSNELLQRTETTYDENGNIKAVLVYTRENPGDAWMPLSK